MILGQSRNKSQSNETIKGQKSRRTIVAGMVAIAALASLTACGGAATADLQPTAATATAQATVTVAIAQPEPSATETMNMSESEMSADPTPTTSEVASAAPTATQASAAQNAPSITEVQATLIEWSIQLSQSQVPAGNVRFTVTNQGQMMHNLTILDSSGVLAQNSHLQRQAGGANPRS